MNEITARFQQLIESQSWKALKQEINELTPQEIAEAIEDMPEGEYQIILFRLLPRETAKETFQHLSYEEQEYIIEGLAENRHKIANLLNDLDPDDRTAFFEELPGKITQRLVQLLSKEEREIATHLLGYPEDSIGRLMTPEYVAVKPWFTIQQAIEHIRKFGRDSETLNVIYVVDDQWKLVDDIRMKEIILASPDQKISDLYDTKFVALNAYDDQEVAVKVFRDYDRSALPVVDTDGILLGIVTVDDMMDVVEEEHTEDFQKFGSLSDTIVNPLKARFGALYKQRIGWLIALVFVNILSSTAISSYENLLESVISLVAFLPLLINSGGNAGSQSATLMIRSLTLGDVQMRDWLRLLGKELIVSLILGLTMAAAILLITAFRAPEVTWVVSTTMVVVVVMGSVIGMLLPFVFTKFKLDPATASAPLITSITDIMGVIIYLSIATWYFGNMG